MDTARCTHRIGSSHSTSFSLSSCFQRHTPVSLCFPFVTLFFSFPTEARRQDKTTRQLWRGRHGAAAAAPATERVPSTRSRDHGLLLHSKLLLASKGGTLEAAARSRWGALCRAHRRRPLLLLFALLLSTDLSRTPKKQQVGQVVVLSSSSPHSWRGLPRRRVSVSRPLRGSFNIVVGPA